MNRIWLRSAAGLDFVSPTRYLIALRDFEIELALSDTPPKIKALRTNSLKPAREQRQAALFCYGMSKRLGQEVFFAYQEDQDYDFVAKWVIGEEIHFAQVQLKEVVPETTNPQASIEAIIVKLGRCTDSEGLTVAIHWNRQSRFESSMLKVSELKIGSLWIFGSAVPDQSRWNIWGNFTEDDPYGSQFSYPEI